MNSFRALFVATGLLAALLAHAEESTPVKAMPPAPMPDQQVDDRVTGHVFRPPQLPAPDINDLKVPKGFRIERFAENLGNARMLAVSPAGHVYFTRRDLGDVVMIKVGATGRAEGSPTRVAARPGMHGITFYKNWVYLATPHEVFRGEVQADGTFGPLEMIIHDLPDAGQHNTRTLAVGPDNMLYIGVGSTTNAAYEPNPESATLLRASLDGKSRSIFASGLRDLVGWGWHPITGELWGMDHGIDWLGDDEQPEELNLIEKGKRYGWPFFYGNNQENPQALPPGGLKKEDIKRASTPMVLGYTAHASPMQLSFYHGAQFPADYRGDAFISMRGSWNRKPASGYEILRIRFNNGKPTGFDPFVTGFISRQGESGRLSGNAIAKDGSLLFTDDRNGIIYRVSYTGKAAASNQATAMPAIPAEPMKKQNQVGVVSPLGHETPELKSGTPLQVTSPAFAAGERIPDAHSAYEQNFSPALQWSGAPAGTQSFVLLMEDPDAKVTPLPVLHWIAWNIPAEATGLPAGLPPSERVAEPKDMRQGPNYSGATGYRGPKPPEKDRTHRYFFQLFALDRKLDLPLNAMREQLLQACQGHVLAAGVLQGTFSRPAEPSKP